MFWKVREHLSHVTSSCRAHARAGLIVQLVKLVNGRRCVWKNSLVNGRLAEVKEEELNS